MSDEPIHILSTAEVPGLIELARGSTQVVFETVRFHHINFVREEKTLARIRELATISNTVVAFTSRNAVEAVAEYLGENRARWKAFGVGNFTTQSVEQHFRSAELVGTAMSAAGLADVILDHKIASIVFFCGDSRREELPEKLKRNGVGVEELIVYKTVYTPVRVEKRYDGILFFSPGAVQSYFIANSPDASVVFFSIGKTTATAVKAHCDNLVLTADEPDKLGLAQKALSYFEEKMIQ